MENTNKTGIASADENQKRNTAGHTPGPWKILRGDGIATIRGSDGHGSFAKIIMRRSVTQNLTELEANARLIVAAPELLAALKIELASITAALDQQDWAEVEAAIPVISAAIAKAEGRTT